MKQHDASLTHTFVNELSYLVSDSMTHWLTHSCTYNVTHACRTQARLSWRTDVQSWILLRCFIFFLFLSVSVRELWDMSHIPSSHPSTKCLWNVREMSWNSLVFLHSCLLKSQFCSQAEHESFASASGISHSPVTLPQLSLPAVKGHEVSGPAEGSLRRGWRVLFTSSLLMCGLVCFNWHAALRELACRLLVLGV